MDKKLILTSWTLLFAITASACRHHISPASQSLKCILDPLCEPYEASEEWVNQEHIKLSGHAMNFTADEESEVNVALKSTVEGYKGTIQWDNVTLYGSAEVKTIKIENLTSGITTLRLTGIFDCGGKGGWPEGTHSDFSATIHLQVDGAAFGSYQIHGSGRLPMQHGDFNFSEETS